jgi:hypothetical protein
VYVLVGSRRARFPRGSTRLAAQHVPHAVGAARGELGRGSSVTLAHRDGADQRPASFPRIHHLSLTMPRASTSASGAAPQPRNVLAVCVAMFHERQGPIIAFSHPPGAAEALAGLEWRALPSGSHALLRRDHIALLPPQPLPTQEEGQHSVVAAVVRSRATAGEEGAERRGNRVICVAAVLGQSGQRERIGWLDQAEVAQVLRVKLTSVLHSMR